MSSLSTNMLTTIDPYFTRDTGDSVATSTKDDHFRLDTEFLKRYEGKNPKFGYNGLGEFVFYRTYSRKKECGTKETAVCIFKRVVEGVYEIQRRYCVKNHIDWDLDRAQRSAQEMFVRMWQFKFLPPGRGLWIMGTDCMWKTGSAALQNCGFISTQHIDKYPSEPFCFTLDMSMLGVGIGFDLRGAGKLKLHKPTGPITEFVVPDSREGWVESLHLLIESYVNPESPNYFFNYSEIRPAGSDIKGFGGKASGPDGLMGLHNEVKGHFDEIVSREDTTVTSTDIVDTMNLIGKCVVAGNVRRVAEIALGDLNDVNYITMKNELYGLTTEESQQYQQRCKELQEAEPFKYEYDITEFVDLDISVDKLRRAVEILNKNGSHRWASNNSVLAEVGMDYDPFKDSIGRNGEPGFFWLDNARNYGRMKDGYQKGIDGRVMGTNPCGEQPLEDAELCNLAEVFPSHHEDAQDFHATLKYAYLYAKTVTLLPTHYRRTNSVMLRNKRIGLGQTGITEAMEKFGTRHYLDEFCDRGYDIVSKWDEIYSDWLCCSKSIKKTTVKPSGTVSLVAGVTPGIHYSVAPSRYYWRRVRIAADNRLVDVARDAGYHVEPLSTDPGTMIIKFAIAAPLSRPISESNIREQVHLAYLLQSYWSDNNISVTVQLKPGEHEDIPSVLSQYEHGLKSISFLPSFNSGYTQMPYEPATKEEVDAYNANIKQMDFSRYILEDAVGTKYCDGESCDITS